MYVCLCVCVSVENRLEREIAYNADFFQSQVPRNKRYPVYSITPVGKQYRKPIKWTCGIEMVEEINSFNYW